MAVDYLYTRAGAEGTTGYFSCEPVNLSFAHALDLLPGAPLDEFLHRYVLRLCLERRLEELERFAPRALREPALASVLLECALLSPRLAPLRQYFGEDAALRFCGASPLPLLRLSLSEDHGTCREQNEIFAANREELRALPHPEDWDSLRSFPGEAPAAGYTLAEAARGMPRLPAEARPPAAHTAARALARLEELGLPVGGEMRHEATLSPIAIQRSWKLAVRVRSRALDYSLKGTATSYGRGLSPAAARASCLMEIVERVCAYFSVDGDEIPGLARPLRLVRAKFSELRSKGAREALDPNALLPDVPYRDEALHWLPAAAARDGRTVLVPAQAAGLFCNLDEPALFTAPGSTGLASGTTPDEAKEAALTEILERDAEATVPYRRSRCFLLNSEQEPLAALLEDYAARGIEIRFQDLANEFGLPVYSAFVVGRRGKIARACGAGLSGRRAVIAALTETPYPYPNGPPSGPGLRGLPERTAESLPDFDQGSAAANRALLEKLLLAHGCEPLYVDLTRADLGFPVVRALAPGLETGAADPAARISRRLLRNYRSMFTD